MLFVLKTHKITTVQIFTSSVVRDIIQLQQAQQYYNILDVFCQQQI